MKSVMSTLIALFLLIAVPGIGNSATIVVPDDYATIQEAITNSVNGDIVLVKPGTYNEFISFQGKAITVRSDVNADASSYDIAPETTIIDGGESWSVVSFFNGEGPDSVLEGFTITNGSGTWITGTLYGGGIYCDQTTPTITRNIIYDNDADIGGGIFCEDADATISHNTIEFNKAADRAGGIMCSHASPTIYMNTILDNLTNSRGGGIEVFEFCQPLIFRNIIKNNFAAKGGGIECFSANPDIINNQIKDNDATEAGGGIYCYASAPIVTNNTIYNNTATIESGGLHCFWYSFPEVTNTILWDDTAPATAEIGLDATSGPIVTYCCVEGGYSGTGNISLDPLFLDPLVSRNLHLSSTSPCINVGDPLATGLPLTDFDNEARIDVTDVDIGMDEFYAYPATELHVPSEYATIQEAINAAPSGAEILVATNFVHEGDYIENLDFMGKDITLRSDEDSDPLTHDIAPTLTILNGNETGSVVCFQTGEGLSTVLEGFTIHNGSGTLQVGNLYGGGIYCNTVSPTIINNIIKWNDTEYGGGIYCNFSDPLISGNVVETNSATLNGGGIMCSDSSPEISKNIIKDNTATFGGGGITAFQYSFPDIVNNLIIKNNAGNGGGIEVFWSGPSIMNNTVHENTATIAGGSLYCDFNSSPTATNTILYDGTAPTGPEIRLEGFSTLDISYSNVEGGSAAASVEAGSTLNWGAGNIDAPGGFVDVANENYHLTVASGCVNGGTNTGAPTEDYDGDVRPTHGMTDIGFDEYTGLLSFIADVFEVQIDVQAVVNFTLDAGVGNAGRQYLILGSVTGTAPGTPMPGGLVTLPINWDFFTNLVISLLGPPIFNDFLGVLGASGDATAQFDSVGPMPPAALGLNMSFAFALVSPWDFASNAVTIQVVAP